MPSHEKGDPLIDGCLGSRLRVGWIALNCHDTEENHVQLLWGNFYEYVSSQFPWKVHLATMLGDSGWLRLTQVESFGQSSVSHRNAQLCSSHHGNPTMSPSYVTYITYTYINIYIYIYIYYIDIDTYIIHLLYIYNTCIHICIYIYICYIYNTYIHIFITTWIHI